MKITKRQLAAYVEAHGFNASPVSVWPRLNKAAEGGIQHLVSVDNGAYYAELWGRGGSYYAVTGAGVYQMPGLAKGAKLEEALDVFLEKVVGKRQDGVPLSALRKMAVDVAAEVEKLEKHVTPGKPHTDRSGHWHQDVQGHLIRVPGKKSEAHIYQNPVQNQVPTSPSKRRRPAPVRSSLPDDWKAPITKDTYDPNKLRSTQGGPPGQHRHEGASESHPVTQRHPASRSFTPHTEVKPLEKHYTINPHTHGKGTGTFPGHVSGPGRQPKRGVAKDAKTDKYNPDDPGSPAPKPRRHAYSGAPGRGAMDVRAQTAARGAASTSSVAKDAGIPKPKASTPPVSPPTTPASPPRSTPRELHTEFSPQSTPQGPRGTGSRGGYPPKKTHAQYRGSPTARDRRDLEKENMPSSIPVSTEPVAKAEPATSKPMTHWHGEHQHTHPNEGPHSHGSDAVVVTPQTTDAKLRSQRAVPGTRVPRQFSHVRRAVTDTPMRGGDTPHGGQVHGHLGDGGVTHSHTYGTHATATPLSMKPKPEDRTPGRYGSGYSEHERRFGHAAGDLRRAEEAPARSGEEVSARFRTPGPKPAQYSDPATQGGEKTRDFSSEQFKPGFVKADEGLNDLQYLAKYHEDRVDMINKTTPLVEKASAKDPVVEWRKERLSKPFKPGQPTPSIRKAPVYTHLQGETHSHDNEIHRHPGGAVSHTSHPGGPEKRYPSGSRQTSKARTYLGPGQTAPRGSEEQEGERGGRYYESPGSPEEFTDPRSQPWTSEDAAAATHAKDEANQGEKTGATPQTIDMMVGAIASGNIDVGGESGFDPSIYKAETLKQMLELIPAAQDKIFDQIEANPKMGPEAMASLKRLAAARRAVFTTLQKREDDEADPPDEDEDDKDIREAEEDTGGTREGYGGNPFLRCAAEAANLDQFVKARTYLKPGETPPKGTTEQEGERGGRYYEPTAQTHTPSVHTEKYEGSHARKPKGTGGWYFQYDDDKETPHIFHGKYAEARRQAVADAKKRGVIQVHALP